MVFRNPSVHSAIGTEEITRSVSGTDSPRVLSFPIRTRCK